MTLQETQLLLQTLTSLSIAGGLFYTAMQFRHWRKATHVANFTKLVELQMQLRRIRVDRPDLASVHQDDVQHLASDREIQEYFLNLMQLSIFEIAWFSHRHGQLPDDYFESWVKRMHAIEHEDSFRRMWSNPSMKIMHDDFADFIRRLMNGAR